MMRFPCASGVIDCQSCDGRLTRVRLMAGGLPRGVENPAADALVLDGFLLGMDRKEVIRVKGQGSAPVKYHGLNLECYPGPTYVFYNDHSILVGVMGNRLDGGPKFYAVGQYGKDFERVEFRHQYI